ncbi:hypothetical protein ACFY0F_23690 [Streptomyces sp. NPDC001544]|uniref:hypothetical protein n=1 Tax=Streptomyces sp. NPDC001544 TaxID=3364584 RepID=UPI0036B8F545
MTGRKTASTITDTELDQLYARLDQAETEARWHAEAESADIAAGSYAGRVEELQAAITRVRAVHQPISRAGFLICAHCSGWNGIRCIGLVRDYPCDTIAALDEPAPTGAATQATDGWEQQEDGTWTLPINNGGGVLTTPATTTPDERARFATAWPKTTDKEQPHA